MAGNLGKIFKASVGVTAAVGLVSLVPPLTQDPERPGQVSPGMLTQFAREDNGRGYCEDNLSGVDCACFAKTAGQVLNNQKPRAMGWSYADPWKLAELQASNSC